MYRVIYAKSVEKEIAKIKNIKLLKGIKAKIEWLADNADYIEHEMLQGNLRGVYCLHYSSYRIIYELNKTNNIIEINKIAHHDRVYNLKN